MSKTFGYHFGCASNLKIRKKNLLEYEWNRIVLKSPKNMLSCLNKKSDNGLMVTSTTVVTLWQLVGYMHKSVLAAWGVACRKKSDSFAAAIQWRVEKGEPVEGAVYRPLTNPTCVNWNGAFDKWRVYGNRTFLCWTRSGSVTLTLGTTQSERRFG